MFFTRSNRYERGLQNRSFDSRCRYGSLWNTRAIIILFGRVFVYIFSNLSREFLHLMNYFVLLSFFLLNKPPSEVYYNNRYSSGHFFDLL